MRSKNSIGFFGLYVIIVKEMFVVAIAKIKFFVGDEFIRRHTHFEHPLIPTLESLQKGKSYAILGSTDSKIPERKKRKISRKIKAATP
jgi:hypothetical protein